MKYVFFDIDGIDQNGKVTEIPCQKLAKIRFDEKVERANIPQRYRNCRIGIEYKRDENNGTAINQASSLIKNRKSAFIQGTCGTGKTMLASILAQESLRKASNFAGSLIISWNFSIFIYNNNIDG